MATAKKKSGTTAKKRVAAKKAAKKAAAKGATEPSLAALIQRAAPEIIVRLAEADEPIGELAALVLVDTEGELRVRVDSARTVSDFIRAQMPDSGELVSSLARRLEGALHCLIVIERGSDEADVTYVALELESRTSN